MGCCWCCCTCCCCTGSSDSSGFEELDNSSSAVLVNMFAMEKLLLLGIAAGAGGGVLLRIVFRGSGSIASTSSSAFSSDSSFEEIGDTATCFLSPTLCGTSLIFLFLGGAPSMAVEPLLLTAGKASIEIFSLCFWLRKSLSTCITVAYSKSASISKFWEKRFTFLCIGKSFGCSVKN